MTTVVLDARPPAALVRVLNPIMRFVLRTPLGRLVKPFALLEFTGRRTGRSYRVPAGWHDAGGVRVVISPASWRANFANGAPALVHHRGRAQPMIGTLVSDPTEVARDIRAVLAWGTPASQIALQIPEGHTLSENDVSSLDRAVIRFRADEVRT
ncbi:MAG: grhN [Actinomycetota bacterium]|nr:grhN [Actinomycetota bacterium]